MKRLGGFLLLLLLWEVIARRVNSPLLSPVSAVLPASWRLLISGELFLHARTSLINILIGFSLAVSVGLTLGVSITQFKTLRSMLMPIVDAMRPVAALTLFPVILVALGLGIASKAFVIFWTAWPAIILNTAEGIYRVDKSITEAAQLDGAGRWALLRHIIIPLALPIIMTGIRIGASGGWISLVAAEMLGASAGLGYAVLGYSQTFHFAEMYAVILTIAVLGLAMNVCLAYAQDKLDYDKEASRAEKYLRFGDRAIGWNLDSVRWFKSASS